LTKQINCPQSISLKLSNNKAISMTGTLSLPTKLFTNLKVSPNSLKTEGES